MTTTNQASTTPATRDPAVDLECDDEFEEFTSREWGPGEDNEGEATRRDPTQWEEDWDDGDLKDDFSKQLRAELESKK